MRDVLILFLHLIVTVVRLARPGGPRSVVAESLLVKQQLCIYRGRKRAPNLRATKRIIAGWCTLFMKPARVLRSAIVLKPSMLRIATTCWPNEGTRLVKKLVSVTAPSNNSLLSTRR